MAFQVYIAKQEVHSAIFSIIYHYMVGNNGVKMAQRGQGLMAEKNISEFSKLKKKFFHIFKMYRSSF